jgi:hypothetical protein
MIRIFFFFFFISGNIFHRSYTMAASILQHSSIAQSPLIHQASQQAIANDPRTGVSGKRSIAPTAQTIVLTKHLHRRPSLPNSQSSKTSIPSGASCKPNSTAKSANAPVSPPNHLLEAIYSITRIL